MYRNWTGHCDTSMLFAKKYIRMVRAWPLVFHWHSVVTSFNRAHLHSITWSRAVDDFQFFSIYINSCFVVINFNFWKLIINPQMVLIKWTCRIISLTVLKIEYTLFPWCSRKMTVFNFLGLCIRGVQNTAWLFTTDRCCWIRQKSTLLVGCYISPFFFNNNALNWVVITLLNHRSPNPLNNFQFPFSPTVSTASISVRSSM